MGHLQEFSVHILAPDKLADLCKDGLEALFRLSVDGKDVGYLKSAQAGQKAVFDGFLTARETVKASDDQKPVTKTVYQAFKFASTQVQLPCICNRYV